MNGVHEIFLEQVFIELNEMWNVYSLHFKFIVGFRQTLGAMMAKTLLSLLRRPILSLRQKVAINIQNEMMQNMKKLAAHLYKSQNIYKNIFYDILQMKQ